MQVTRSGDIVASTTMSGKGLDLAEDKSGARKSLTNESGPVETVRKRSMFRPIDSSPDEDPSEKQRVDNLQPIK